MELQIRDLVDAIKKEGVDAAQAEAERILNEAKASAAEIVARAKEEAESILEKAEAEKKVMTESVKIAAEHTKRDALLAFRQSVQSEFQKLLSAETEKALNCETLAKLISAAIMGEDASLYAAEVHEVTEGLKKQLADEIRAGLEIRTNADIQAGFRLAAKDGSGYFDCSDEEILKMLAPYFSDFRI